MAGTIARTQVGLVVLAVTAAAVVGFVSPVQGGSSAGSSAGAPATGTTDAASSAQGE